MAVETLRRRQWLVLEVQPESTAADPAAGWFHVDLAAYWPVSTGDVELSLRQLAVMLRSGLALLDALRMLGENSQRSALARIWKQVADGVLAGESLADSMSRHRCFPPVVVQLARVGEQTGELDVVLTRAASMLEQWRKLRSQILTVMAYPIVVFIAAIAVAGFMVFNVIPKLQRFLQTMGRKLPPLTQLLVDVTDFINAYVLQGLGLLVVLVVAIVLIRRWPPGRLWTDRFLLRVPVFGSAIRVAATASFSNNMDTLLRSGVTVLESLRSMEQLIGNRYVAAQVGAARDDVVQGRTLADALVRRAPFAPMLARMVAIGESAGRLDDVLAEAARYYDDLLQRTIRKLAALVEPVMLLTVGGIVGFVYISFFMALFAAASRN
jgi:type IV pilus assembly protein PilC